jgi:GT2 family glycosyltransferase/glycosyltransferase involved in cell wall biosynthesis
MTVLSRVKKELQDRLSLSSKLFLKETLAGARRSVSASINFAKRVGGAAASRGIPVPSRLRPKTFSLEPPHLEATDLIASANLLADKVKAKDLASATVKTSIIIPVFNKVAFTLQCLRSLADEIDLAETEIIVVNNASTDETQKVLSLLSGFVRAVDNTENLGFVDACNQGAAEARGKYLIFLNNDTEVMPGWLEHLVRTVESDDSVGAVGSMFLYPDGSIQEAGSIVWKNGEAHHYGWGESPDDYRFNFAREVDYCSAASLLIRRDIFERLGGFDRRYAPAYYEDVDLCFGVRSLGFKVIYQPMSRLVHYEGATAGRDATAGMKAYQVRNRAKFLEKWQEVLNQSHPEKDLKRATQAANRHRGASIMVFDERVPSPDRDAGSLRMSIILKTLAQTYQVIFVPFNRPQSIDYERALWKEGIETADAVDYRRLIRQRNVKVAIVSRPSMAEAFIRRIRRTSSGTRIVFDTVDLHFRRLQREYDLSQKTEILAEAERDLKLERKFARESDLVWCASPEDKHALEREAPETRIEVVPTIHALHESGQPFEMRQNLLFIGNLAHRPNVDGILYFIREVFPRLRQKLPQIQLDIIGDFAPAEVAAVNSDALHVRGFVPDTEPYLHSRRVFIAPLRFGAGIKGKIGEAMSYGIPVVTTSVGAEGFGVEHGVNLMIADDADSFAEKIEQLYTQRDLWESIAKNSRAHIGKHFTPEVIAETINRSLSDLDR